MQNKVTRYITILVVALVTSLLVLVVMMISKQQISNALYNEQLRSELLLSEKMQLLKTMNKLNDSLNRQAEKNNHLQQQLKRTKFADRQ